MRVIKVEGISTQEQDLSEEQVAEGQVSEKKPLSKASPEGKGRRAKAEALETNINGDAAGKSGALNTGALNAEAPPRQSSSLSEVTLSDVTRGAVGQTPRGDEAKQNKRPLSQKAAAIQSATGSIPAREPVQVNLRTLLKAGVHFGHQTSRWCPAMAPFIHSSRNGIHIINLPHTAKSWEVARNAVIDIAANGGNVLFVGTKKQAHDAVVTEARRCGAFYVSRRWLGGMLTNFQTIRRSIDRLQKLELLLNEEENASAQGHGARYTKKERLMMSRERDKLEFSLGGIRTMMRPPQLMFVVDIRREDIAIREAKRIDIPVVALVDTNCDPRTVTYPIPSNDDGTRAIRMFCAAMADAITEGRALYEQRKSAGLIKEDSFKVASVTAKGASPHVEVNQMNDSSLVVSEETSEDI